MANPFLGEIRMFAGTFAPLGWAFCDGQQLSIADNSPLFAVIGTTYGGNGQTTFSLPDLRGRVPIHMGTSPATGTTYTLGEVAGTESVTLNGGQIPLHTHPVGSNSGVGNQSGPSGAVWSASETGTKLYSTGAPAVDMAPGALGAAGGNQPHDNRMPYLAVNFIIALDGVFPSQN